MSRYWCLLSVKTVVFVCLFVEPPACRMKVRRMPMSREWLQFYHNSEEISLAAIFSSFHNFSHLKIRQKNRVKESGNTRAVAEKQPTMPKDGSSLSNQAILTKIDKLRELNIGKTIPLPQVRDLLTSTTQMKGLIVRLGHIACSSRRSIIREKFSARESYWIQLPSWSWRLHAICYSNIMQP